MNIFFIVLLGYPNSACIQPFFNEVR